MGIFSSDDMDQVNNQSSVATELKAKRETVKLREEKTLSERLLCELMANIENVMANSSSSEDYYLALLDAAITEEMSEWRRKYNKGQ